MSDIIIEIENKLRNNIPLNEGEIETMLMVYTVVYEECGVMGRWNMSMTTVVKVDNFGLYAIEWTRGLTEMQEDEYADQPEKVELHEKEVVKTVIEIVYLDKLAEKGDRK